MQQHFGLASKGVLTRHCLADPTLHPAQQASGIADDRAAEQQLVQLQQKRSLHVQQKRCKKLVDGYRD